MSDPSASSDPKTKSSSVRQSIKLRRTKQNTITKFQKQRKDVLAKLHYRISLCVCVCVCGLLCTLCTTNSLPPTTLQGRQEKEKTREEKANKASNDDHRFFPPVVVTNPHYLPFFFDTAKPFGNFVLLIYYQSFPSALPSLTFSRNRSSIFPSKQQKEKKNTYFLPTLFEKKAHFHHHLSLEPQYRGPTSSSHLST